MREGAATLQVNLFDYLDTGLFLDHRPLRARMALEARGKHFLNLFCYTGVATVQAAVQGATQHHQRRPVGDLPGMAGREPARQWRRRHARTGSRRPTR